MNNKIQMKIIIFNNKFNKNIQKKDKDKNLYQTKVHYLNNHSIVLTNKSLQKTNTNKKKLTSQL